MKTEDILALAIPAMYLVMAVIVMVRPARKYPDVRRWSLLGFGFLVVMMTLGAVIPLLLPVEWLATHRLLDGTKLGVGGGAVVGYLVLTFVAYWMHRFFHQSQTFWRWTHQMHHAPRRLDIPGSVVFHPFELVIQNALSIGLLVFVLGLEPMAAVIIGTFGAFVAMWQHWNVRTPHVIGYVLQRPEQHNIHHQTDVHGFNYGDIALWDLCFGTFQNPKTFEGEVGFAQPAPFGKMLLGVDVHATATPNASQAKQEPLAAAAE
jgi:sterol desaturase/sphingolipid hydroxylase (fatty acid hydroxylase superfamily)